MKTTTPRKFDSVATLVEEKPLFSEKDEFEYTDESKILAFFGLLGLWGD